MPMAVLSRKVKTKETKNLNQVVTRRMPGSRDEAGWVSIEEMLQQVPWVKLFAIGREDPLDSLHKLHCMICKVNVSMLSLRAFEIKRHYQSAGHLRQDQL